ncbi:RraA family protein [Terrimesophilobacter mesophilus]|uniref:Putative 4-hydroxy-4-methyl-2-oxoglutarate aldolase n=2 Tax=Terrimesophilobacter mesophilus TaxID=433647 RepID=A0A4R8VEE1_9MICO|nr:RraA family protein [Terrimesophilobacter mesophilus]TFB80886.1 RraA family protein [Terrimesophilobacter mesophilus]
MPTPETPAILPTATVADAATRLGIAVQTGPQLLRPLLPGRIFAGPAMPVTHLGSVDVILETIDDSPSGGVLVVDNGGRRDEACVGDLLALEAKLAGLSGIVIWGLHRDTAQLREIDLPLHSLGAYPYGPRRVPPAGRRMAIAMLDGVRVSEGDHIVGDDDGILVVGPARRNELFELAASIQSTESAQSDRMRAGTDLRTQLDFAGYRKKQASDPRVTLRQHLKDTGSAIET